MSAHPTKQPEPRRREKPWIWPLLAILLAAAGCGDDDDTTDAGPGVGDAGDSDAGFPDAAVRLTTLELGDAPRRVLRAAPATPRTWRVVASSVHTTRVDDDEATETAETTQRMRVSFSRNSDGPIVTLWPRIERFESSYGTRLTGRDPGPTIQRFDERGRMLSEGRSTRDVSEEVLDAATLAVFRLPRTYLGVPEEAVGVGARWVQDIDEGEYVIRVEERITAMDDDVLRVERTVSLVENRGRIQSVASSQTATYETSTLFLRATQIDNQYTFAASLPVEGVPSPFVGVVASSRTIDEVTP